MGARRLGVVVIPAYRALGGENLENAVSMGQYTSNLKGTSLSTAVVVRFSSGATAAGLVAGVPAAARAIREVALAGLGQCLLDVGGGAPLTVAVREEILRLAGAMDVQGLDKRETSWRAGHGAANVSADAAPPLPSGRMLLISGEALVDAATIRAALSVGASLNPALNFVSPADAAASLRIDQDAAASTAHYAAAGKAIVKATAKTTDGLVSRNINRPISQAISNLLLRIPGIRPIQATMGTATLGVLMFAVLVLMGSPVGLVAGAILFQAASVFDGVDGEIARATYRSTTRGAMIDSLIDAATNLSFVAGIVINLAQRGHWGTAMFGIAGLAMLALGLTTLGMRARRSGGPITFDGLKGHFRDNGSGWGKWAVWLTMRDFLALASVVLVVAGLTDQAIMAFSAIMAVWLVVVLTTHARQSRSAAEQGA
jgi:phosphatidylglycerophosphate synthase